MTRRRVLLIGWDAADWKVIRPLMDAGAMPNVRRLVEGGASGQIATLHPCYSPMLWTSIATGKRPFHHGIHGFSEPTPDGTGIQPVTNLSRKAKALWNILNQNGLRSVAIGWWPSHPAEPINGVMVSDHYHRASGALDEGWPLPAHTVHPQELSGTMARLRVHPDQLTAAMVEPFVPRAREVDQDRDRRLAACMRTLAECMSIQAAALWLAENEPWDFFAVYFDAIDHFCHGFMKYHPPRQKWIGERDFELYGGVVEEAYRFHDRMLGELWATAGDETTVVLLSDHGFHPDHLRPSAIPDVPAGPAVEHRDYGVLAMAGPGVQAGEALHGASLLDIAPTVLTLYGLPAGEDMEGKVLTQALRDPAEIPRIGSWEGVAGEDGSHPAHTRLDPVAAHEALEQMVALGYIERPDENRAVAVERTVRELRYNLGEAYQDAGRHKEAYEIFRELRGADRDEQRYAVRLFVSCQALGRREEMRAIVEDLLGRRQDLFEQAKAKVATWREGEDKEALERWRNLMRYQPAATEYLQAQIWISEGRFEEALAGLERVAGGNPTKPRLWRQIADLYGRMGRASDAEGLYAETLEADPDDTEAHLGLCRAALRRRGYGDAAHAALDALQRVGHDPMAHFLLGRALAGLKEYQRAAEIFRTAISYNPNFPEAHIRLAGLLERHLNDPETAREHRRLARRMRSGIEARKAELVSVDKTGETADGGVWGNRGG